MKFRRPFSNSIWNCHSPNGIKLIIRLRIGLGHLREHKFRYNFQDTLYPICSRGDNIEASIHSLLHCPNYFDEKGHSWTTFKILEKMFMIKNDFQIWELRLLGFFSNNASNTLNLHATIQYILATKRFDVRLTNTCIVWKIRIFSKNSSHKIYW